MNTQHRKSSNYEKCEERCGKSLSRVEHGVTFGREFIRLRAIRTRQKLATLFDFSDKIGVTDVTDVNFAIDSA
jgi:hypothetical protein